MLPSLSSKFLLSCTLQESSTRMLSLTPALERKRTSGKYRSTINRSQMLTYEMAQRPYHIGIRKSWLTWHTANLDEFRLKQGVVVAQDEVIRRFIRGILYDHRVIDGSEIVIKRRGNAVFVSGFLKYGRRLDIRRIYWLWGFVEEFLSQVLKQPVKLEFQFVEDEKELAFNYI
ncbi:unnamed protein product [Bursaphelenchus okinawaensis]|uniref:Uncharacterized protein n=1 Tax=Bursaphelenchus okinawaensis TaxID=465554 RepID=A0A811KTC2_9BILA|nr:unnamed protein product [Bursaphelenchus okinawaensis]CAG9109285.1 unnamed protein product [Bursaphelenchus okinawaensis]